MDHKLEVNTGRADRRDIVVMEKEKSLTPHPEWHPISYIVHYFSPGPYKALVKSSAL
jgi:hypothetical protein